MDFAIPLSWAGDGSAIAQFGSFVQKSMGLLDLIFERVDRRALVGEHPGLLYGEECKLNTFFIFDAGQYSDREVAGGGVYSPMCLHSFGSHGGMIAKPII